MAIRPTRTQEQKRMDAIAAQGGSGGVGENVGQHNERFNGYTTEDGCTIIGGDYNHAIGYLNSLINNSSYSFIGGSSNYVSNGTYSFMFGNSNTASVFSYSGCVGNNNEIYNADNTFVCSRDSYIAGTAGALICGQSADTRTLGINPANLRFLVGGANSSDNHNVFYVTYLGEVYAKGSYNTIGADYAEYFEWADGNPLNEDRIGLLVSLYGDKIELAHGDDFIGAVSVNPSMVGNAQFTNWRGRFETDVFGRTLHDECGKPIVSDDYNPKMKYIPRADRPEWSPIGLVGRLIIVDDGSCKVGGYVSARHGIGTACFAKTAARVLKRIDDKHIEVLIK